MIKKKKKPKKVIEVVINNCYGGFSLSRKAFLALRKLKQPDALKEPDYGEKYEDGSVRQSMGNLEGTGSFCSGIKRNDPLFLRVVRRLGKKANGGCSSLKIIKIPAGVKWHVEEYDGNEWVAEDHRQWS